MAQSQSETDPASSLASAAASAFVQVASEGFSIYTELTALIGAAGSATATPDSSTTTPSSRSSVSASTSHRSSSTATIRSSSSRSLSTSVSSSRSSKISSTVAAAASATSTGGLSPPDANDNHRSIAIIIGSVLGALVLFLLVLLALLLSRRRRRRREREGGVTPTSDEIASWRNTHGTTSYAPVTEFPHHQREGMEQGATTSSAPQMSDAYNTGDMQHAGVHPAYRDMDQRELVRERTHDALMKEAGIGAGAAAVRALAAHDSDEYDRPTENVAAGTKRKRYSIPRKPLAARGPGNGSSESLAIHNGRNADGRQSHETDQLVSPISPVVAELPSQAFPQRPEHLRNDSRDALLADTDTPGTRNDRPSFDRDDSFTAVLPAPLQPRQSTYTAWKPGVSPSPHGPSPPSHPAPAIIAAYRNQDRDAPSIPPRSPKRRSWDHTPPSGNSTDSVTLLDQRRSSTEADGEEIPVMWRKNADGARKSMDAPRMPPKGVTYHDFVPVRRDQRDSGPPAAAWGAVRNKEDARRASFNDLTQVDRRKHDKRKQHTSGGYDKIGPTLSEYAVGQAL